jgi:hypothetical protein
MLRLPDIREDREMKYSQRAPHAHTVAAGHSGRPAGWPARIRAIRPAQPEYDRRTTLCSVLALWPQEIEDDSLAGRLLIVAKLRRALRVERQRGLAGHWTYDLARHAELLRAYKQELRALSARNLDETGPGSRR